MHRMLVCMHSEPSLVASLFEGGGFRRRRKTEGVSLAQDLYEKTPSVSLSADSSLGEGAYVGYVGAVALQASLSREVGESTFGIAEVGEVG